MTSRWHDIPFIYNIVNFKKNDVDLTLPFKVGGATQQGTEHILDNHNNQDAMSIAIDSDFIIGVVCDGCSGTHDDLRGSFSNNEVGAKYLAYIITKNAQQLLSERCSKDPDLFVQALSNKISSQLISFVKTTVGNDEKEREIFIFDFLMSTIIGFVITKEYYVIFGLGDGVIAVNNNFTIIDEEGLYFAASILSECCPSIKYSIIPSSHSLKIFNSGLASDVKNIFLATDGFREIANNYKPELINFLTNCATNHKVGFDFLIQEFRKYILGNDNIAKYSTMSNWPKDDASFLLLRKIDTNIIKTNLSNELINQGTTK